MFRASDIFGRRPGAVQSTPIVKEEEGGRKRVLAARGYAARVWDPATGKYHEEELPAEVQALMGFGPKRAKHEMDEEESWGVAPAVGTQQRRTLGPSAVGLSAVKSEQLAQEAARAARRASGLVVQFTGFAKAELNTKFTERIDEEVQGRVTYWDPSDSYFIYWQSSMQRWAICDRASLQLAQNGLAPGWAYRNDAEHFSRSRGWMEVYGRDWRNANTTVIVLSGSIEDDGIKTEPKEQEGGAVVPVEQYHALIRRVYEERNPSKLPDLPKLFQKFSTREHEFYLNVCEKYEVDADEYLAQGPALAASQHYVSKELSKEKPAGAGYDSFNEEDLPQLTAKAYAVLTQTIYEENNPEKLRDIGTLLKKYKPRKLYLEVCKKYGIHPVEFHDKHAASIQEHMRVKPEQ